MRNAKIVLRQQCQRWRLQISITLYTTMIAMTFIVGFVTALASDDQLQRREIASISASQLNRNRNLRQTYDGNGVQYSEIHPSHSFFEHDEYDSNFKRNGTDNRKPSFYACKDYAPSVKEEQPQNTFVVKVEARDPDEEDTITYSFEKSASERAKFRINEKTGDIYTSYTFDRDEPIREKEVCIFSAFHFFSLHSLSLSYFSHLIFVEFQIHIEKKGK